MTVEEMKRLCPERVLHSDEYVAHGPIAGQERPWLMVYDSLRKFWVVMYYLANHSQRSKEHEFKCKGQALAFTRRLKVLGAG